jgi:putative transcriptional regulator
VVDDEQRRAAVLLPPWLLTMGATPIRNNIRRLRFEANEMTQAELAERVGVTRQTLLAIEAAKYSPTLELAFKIAKVFGVPLDAVFQYEE